MDEINIIFNQIADDYSQMLLNWAYKKLGDRDKAEDLAQEVLLQVFAAISKSTSDGVSIEKMDNFVWKIAHYAWCHYLRKNEHYKMCVPADNLQLEENMDFVADLAENEYQKQLILRMREKIVSLNFLQREIMIMYYIDGASINQIAMRYNIGESTVKWHLFDTRKKLKKEITTMENNDFVYRPRKLHMGMNGQACPNPDTKVIENSLTKQNICIICYHQPKTINELTEILGIPKAYIENDIEWLVAREFLIESKTGYSTSFMIETAEDEQRKYAIYLKHKNTMSDVIISELTTAEEKIRSIGFYGCDKPLDKLLWLLIYRFCNYQPIPYVADDAPVRPDGGKYFPLGFDRTDFSKGDKSLDTTGWAYNGSMCNDNYWWFGLYNFGQSEIEDMMDEYTAEWKNLHEMLCNIIQSDNDISTLDENQKFNLSKLVQKGFITISGKNAFPNFCVFTSEQYQQLEEAVFEPIVRKLEKEIVLLANDLAKLCKIKVPKQLKNYYNLFVRMALCDIGYVTTIFAFQDGKLYKPRDNHDGEFLTLVYIKR